MDTLTFPIPGSYEAFTGSTGLHFYWSEREDGAEVFCARHNDGSSTDILSAEELGSAEEFIHSLAHQ